jgi:regulator of replication initiation timing
MTADTTPESVERLAQYCEGANSPDASEAAAHLRALAAENAALRAEVDRLREALVPFAKDAAKAYKLSPNNTIMHITTCRVRDLRRARSTLARLGGGE